MAAIHWTLNGGALWTAASDWSSLTVPDSSDDAFIGTNNAIVTSNGNITVDSIGTGTNNCADRRRDIGANASDDTATGIGCAGARR